jgi:hypothetical protein
MLSDLCDPNLCSDDGEAVTTHEERGEDRSPVV